MAYLTTELRWHDLRIDYDDTPEDEEPVLVTVELFNGNREVWLDVYLKHFLDPNGVPFGSYCWMTQVANEDTGMMEEVRVWNKVIAWAYPPSPYNYF